MSSEKDNETKLKIRSAVKEILRNSDGGSLNIRNISKATGLSPGTIYYHYANKADIIIDVVDEHWNKCFDNIVSSIKEENFLKAIDSLYGYILGYFIEFRSHWIKHLSMLDFNYIRNGRRYESDYMDKIKAQICDMIHAHIEEISDECINTLGIEGLAQFVFGNFMSNMRKGENNTACLLYVIGKVIS